MAIFWNPPGKEANVSEWDLCCRRCVCVTHPGFGLVLTGTLGGRPLASGGQDHARPLQGPRASEGRLARRPGVSDSKSLRIFSFPFS